MNDTLETKAVATSDFLGKMFYMNSLLDYLIALAILTGGITLLKLARKIAKKRLTVLNGALPTFFLQVENYMYPLTYLLIIFAAFHWLTFPAKVLVFFNYVFTVGFIFLAIRLISASVRTVIYGYLKQKDESGEQIKQVNGLVLILNGVLWIIGLLFLFDNLGFNVTAVLTGLGVGGIAVALAAQTILGDIFNYFVIFFDRPFEVGDFIVVDDKLGVVEYIGLKTTRLSSLQGEQIIFSNSNLTNSRIHNYKRMAERRILFRFGVTYGIDKKKLAQIPDIMKSIIEKESEARFDRAHFASYGDYSLLFEVVYYMLSSDYNKYMDVQQKINLAMYETFEQMKIDFAFPTYSIDIKSPVRFDQKGTNASKSVTEDTSAYR